MTCQRTYAVCMYAEYVCRRAYAEYAVTCVSANCKYVHYEYARNHEKEE